MTATLDHHPSRGQRWRLVHADDWQSHRVGSMVVVTGVSYTGKPGSEVLAVGYKYEGGGLGVARAADWYANFRYEGEG